MKKLKIEITESREQPFAAIIQTTAIVIGIIAVTAIVFQYSGRINSSLGFDGGQIQIDGSKK